jgi:hypothetical protein
MAAPELGSHALLATLEKRSCTAHPNGFYAANVMA